jgi:hypothetical protein
VFITSSHLPGPAETSGIDIAEAEPVRMFATPHDNEPLTVWTTCGISLMSSTLDESNKKELDSAINELETSVKELDNDVNVVLSSAIRAPSEFTEID